MSDTPRTDSAQCEGLLRGNAVPTHVVHVTFARQLERERDAALAANAELLERLRERTESHLAASARDVQTIQQQSVMLERLAAALKSIAWIKETGNRDYSWTGDTAFEALSAYNRDVQTIQQQAVEIDRLKSVLADIYSLSRS